MRSRIKYSQNFLRDSSLVKNLLSKTTISSSDIVYEIGAGEGIITRELLSKASKVVAFEIDYPLFEKLSLNFKNKNNLGLINQNFLTHPLPSYPFKVFSNIPFNITSAVIKKLTSNPSPPQDSYLIVQEEAAKMFAGKPVDNKNSLKATLIYPWFKLSIIYKFKSEDFYPKPSVDIVLLEIKKRDKPLVEAKDKTSYEDFVVYKFNKKKNPSEISFEAWLSSFRSFLKSSKERSKIIGSYARLISEQENIEKIHRTRTDRNWKKY